MYNYKFLFSQKDLKIYAIENNWRRGDPGQEVLIIC